MPGEPSEAGTGAEAPATPGAPFTGEGFPFSILDTIPDGIIVQNPDMSLAYANRAAVARLGFSSTDDLIRATISARLAPFAMFDESGRPVAPDELPGRRALRGEPDPEAVLRYTVQATGQEFWARVRARVLRDRDGDTIGVINQFQDITEEHRAADALRFLAEASAVLSGSLDYETTLNRLSQLIVPRLADWCVIDVVAEGAPRRLAVAHADEHKMAWARELEARYPVDLSEPTGVGAVLRGGETMLVPQITDQMLEEVARDAEHLRLLQLAGIRSTLVVPLRARSRVLGALTLITAESGRRYGQTDLGLAGELAGRAAAAVDNALLYHEAQQAARARDEFLSIASHELKTPLTTQAAYVQLAERELAKPAPNLERVRERIAQLAQQSRRLQQLVQDLLDASRLNQQRLALRLEPLELSQLTREVLDRHAEAQSDDRHSFTLVAPVPIVGYWDRGRLDQVLTNLIGNAVKYSPDGGEISTRLWTDGAQAELTVSDQGLGIDPADLAALFQPFFRASSAREVGGTGLGLYITRELVSQHGGTIDVTSRRGVGTTFTVRLPLVAG